MSTAVASAHVRIARPTNDIPATKRFYCEGLGLKVLFQFDKHDGFDGIMLGLASANYHFEFTRKEGHDAGRAPTEDNLVVFYLPDEVEWEKAIDKMIAAGYQPLPSFNPYWDVKGKTFEDPDGYRVVLQNAGWVNSKFVD